MNIENIGFLIERSALQPLNEQTYRLFESTIQRAILGREMELFDDKGTRWIKSEDVYVPYEVSIYRDVSRDKTYATLKLRDGRGHISSELALLSEHNKFAFPRISEEGPCSGFYLAYSTQGLAEPNFRRAYVLKEAG